MENIMNVDPGLIIWTLINFGIFLFILIKFGTKPLLNGLHKREEGIKNSIEQAQEANRKAQELFKESQEKIGKAKDEMAEIIKKGHQMAEEHIRKAIEEADKAKQAKVEEAKREIDRSKDAALKVLRSEVAGLVIEATEKIIGVKLDKEKDFQMIENSIKELPKN
jgi:F-type H+-transporting ATPase subunit b